MTNQNEEIVVLLVDDSEEDRHAFRRFLQNMTDVAFSFREAETIEEGLQLFQSEQPDCVLLDFNLPDGNGLEFAARAQALRDDDSFATILMTGQGSEELAMEAMKTGITDYLPKRLANSNSLRRSVLNANERVLLHRSLKEEQREKDRLITDLQRALAEVRQLSGLLPICAHCKSIRRDNGYWQQVEGYLSDHSDARFSHGICPDCLVKEYGLEVGQRIMHEINHPKHEQHPDD